MEDQEKLYCTLWFVEITGAHIFLLEEITLELNIFTKNMNLNLNALSTKKN